MPISASPRPRVRAVAFVAIGYLLIAIASVPTTRAWGWPTTATTAGIVCLGLAMGVGLALAGSGRRVVAALVSYVWLVAAVVVLAGLVESPAGPPAVRHLTTTVGPIAALALPLQFLLTRFATRQQTRRQLVECAIRPAPPTDFSRDRWQHGSLHLRSGVLHFTPGGPGGLRHPRGRPRPFPLASMSDDTGVRPSWRQAWSIGTSVHVVTVRDGDASWQLAADPGDLKRLRSLLA